MYIKQITIAKYRHLENIMLGPFSPPGQASELIVLAGPNGGGKSSVLELISLALSNLWSLSYSLNRTAPSNAFEVTIGLLPDELQLLQQHPAVVQRPDALAYLNSQRSYCRSFNFQGGEYSKQPPLHNFIHDNVIQVLRGHWSKPLGFHLGSERSYQRRPFDRNKIFNYSNYISQDHTWSFAFQTSNAQYEDMFDFLVTWRYHFTRRLGAYHLQKAAGTLPVNDPGPPVDVYGAILDKTFPGYQFVDKEEAAPTDLHVRIPSGDVISFSDLSSGEKEVFFTLCFFQRHNVQDAVIVIDEPEVHLHPSLARLLLRTMLEVKPRNQLWLATQSAEVIDEAGRDRVWFIRRHETTRKAEVVAATDEEPQLSCLRDFFGQSGYIGLARAMVFTEGRNASADRKMFARLFPQHAREIKFIPASGCSEVERINRAVLSIIESNLGWCRFMLVRDRDYMTPETVAAIKQRSGTNLFILSRHEIENYLLDCEAIGKVLSEIFDQPHSAEEVRHKLHSIASAMAGNVLRDMVAYRLNHKFRPEDFSVPKVLDGELSYSQSAGWDTAKMAIMQKQLDAKCQSVANALAERAGTHKFGDLFAECQREVEQALASDGWISVFPGKQLLEQLCKTLSIGKQPILQNSIIKEMAGQPARVPAELQSIIAAALA